MTSDTKPKAKHSPRRSGSRRERRGSRRRSNERNKPSSSSDERASSPSWNVDRGRSRVRRPSNPFSEDSLRRRGYHSIFSSFGKVFHVERRWKMIRDMGSGAYGVVISAADEISGETVAIKLVTRVFEKVSLAKRALREITLLRHFSNHENITGLIDVDAISSDFNEIYLFLEPMEADLHQIIKSGQALTNEHVQYFVYQILRGMKYIHSAGVVHRDLKPGNLLVNADCELKICDFGLSRGFDAAPDDGGTHMTEYVATRWYRAPEIMLAFRRYDYSIDVWSIGCILGELLMGKPLFKGKDYVDQLNKILDVLGTPEELVMQRIGSDKAQTYVRSLPIRRTVPFQKILPSADPQAIALLTKLLDFDPKNRLSVPEALEHPWLASYHDVTDEPDCPFKYDKWRDIEKLETIPEFKEALWKEIQEYRAEARSIDFSFSNHTISIPARSSENSRKSRSEEVPRPEVTVESEPEAAETSEPTTVVASPALAADIEKSLERNGTLRAPTPSGGVSAGLTNDPLVSYARRSSTMHSHQPSASSTSMTRHDSYIAIQPTINDILPLSGMPPNNDQGTVPFPGQGSYIIPARSRTASTAGEYVPRKLLRTLSTVSIHETGEGFAGGLAAMGPVARYITEKETAADAPASEMPRDFDIAERSDEDEDDLNASGKSEPTSGKGRSAKSAGTGSAKDLPKKKRDKRFIIF